MKTLAALAVMAMLVVCTAAQEASPKKISVTSYGDSTESLVDGLTQQGLEVRLVDCTYDELPEACVLWTHEIEPEPLAELLSMALDAPVHVDGSSILINAGETGPVKGYDVSILAGQYVEYINDYAPARKPDEEDEDTTREWTAAEHLSGVIESLLYIPNRSSLSASIVGDRILMTQSARDHDRVREFLGLLMKEGGGESTALAEERAVHTKLNETRLSVALYEETPLASIVAALGSAADINIAVAHDLQYECTDVHVSFNGGGDVTAHERLQKILTLMRELEIEVGVGIRGGGIVLSGAAYLESCHLGYRVYDMGELLKKLSAGYQRQRTAPGKQGGFDGDLRQAGGIGVIVDAIEDQLGTQNRDALVQHFGTRLIVRGSAETIDAVNEILIEMGWEPPKE